MKLDDTQKQTVAGWIQAGLKLADIQKRLAAELGLNLTYMEVRFLVDDLKLVPKDPEPPKPAAPPAAPAASAPPSPGPGQPGEEGDAEDDLDGGLPPEPEAPAGAPVPGGKVSVSVDQITRPGALISGKVTFSDGNTAEWYLDQYGRLGVAPTTKGYKPPQADIAQFQVELQNQLQRMGL